MDTIKSKYLTKILGDFQLLSEIILKQLGLVRTLLEKGTNENLHEEIEKNELLIDSLDVKLRDEVINAIFLFSPKAMDLRKVISYHDMTIYLERVGDLLLNISHFLRKIQLEPEIYAEFRKKLMKMLKYSETMVKNAVFAFSGEDNSMAYMTISTDDKVDELFKELTDLLNDSFTGRILEPQDMINITGINSISYNIERIADNATNIAEAAIYLMEGKDIRHGKKSQNAE